MALGSAIAVWSGTPSTRAGGLARSRARQADQLEARSDGLFDCVRRGSLHAQKKMTRCLRRERSSAGSRGASTNCEQRELFHIIDARPKCESQSPSSPANSGVIPVRTGCAVCADSAGASGVRGCANERQPWPACSAAALPDHRESPASQQR
jgi:hypothetical protein